MFRTLIARYCFQVNLKPTNSGPAIMQPTQEPPAYTKSAQQSQPKPTLNTEDLQVH